eukprot:900874_1
MSASFPPMMFSMEELVGVVKLIIQMESAVAANDDEKIEYANNNHRHRNGKHSKHNRYNKYNKYNKHHKKYNQHHKNEPREPPNIQRWISRRSKRDILFLLASISGVKMKIYSLPISHKLNKNSSSKNKIKKNMKLSIIRERVCRVSVDGKYLSMGEDCINLDRRLEISLGIDMCYSNIHIILKQLGLYNYYTHSYNNIYDSSSATTPSSYDSHHGRDHNMITDEIIKNARFNHKISGNDKLKPKHCITIHDPATSRTLILQLSNCSDKNMWAKGLCHLKHLNQKARNFRWTVVAYLISKYASTLNAHSTNNLNNVKGLKGVTKGLNALKMGLTGNKNKSHAKHSHSHSHKPNPMSAPCYVQPFVSLINIIGTQNNNGLHQKYPKRYNEMYKRRQNRIKK